MGRSEKPGTLGANGAQVEPFVRSRARNCLFFLDTSLPRQMKTRTEPAAACCARHRVLWVLGFLLITLGSRGAEKVVPDFTALARQASVSLPAPPAWAPSPSGATWSSDEFLAELGRFTETPPRVNMIPSRLLRPDPRWTKAFARWFRDIQKPLKITFRDQAWDCDDYANCFVAFADLLVLKAGGASGGFCVGRASVYYRKAFGGIPARSAHAVVIVGTNDGVFIIEPQDGTVVALQDFPNRDTIEEINF